MRNTFFNLIRILYCLINNRKKYIRINPLAKGKILLYSKVSKKIFFLESRSISDSETINHVFINKCY